MRYTCIIFIVRLSSVLEVFLTQFLVSVMPLLSPKLYHSLKDLQSTAYIEAHCYPNLLGNFFKSSLSTSLLFSSNWRLSSYLPLSPAPSNLSLSGEISSNRQFRQIRRFRLIRRFRDTPLVRSFPQI